MAVSGDFYPRFYNDALFVFQVYPRRHGFNVHNQ